MLWIALHLHRLALEAIGRAHAAGASGRLGNQRREGDPHDAASRLAPEPLAVCDRLRVLQACPVAWAQGVRPGMRRVTALAVAPRLLAIERDVVCERGALEQVAGWALRFTPAVSLQPPEGLLLEAAGSLRLFGGLRPLLRELRAGLASLGFSAGWGVAPTAAGAWLRARARQPAPGRHARAGAAPAPDRQPADGVRPADAARLADPARLAARLAGLPVTLLDAAAPHAVTLAGLGVQRIGELLRLPRDGVARRFGPALLDELDRAHGHLPELRAWYRAPELFDARLALPGRVEAAEALVFAARRLLLLAAHWLALRQAATLQLALDAEHESRAPTRIELRLASAGRDPERFAALLRERLAWVCLPAPACALRLRCEACVPIGPANGMLFAQPADAADGLARLIERLQARLGRERVLRLLPTADHRPERAYRIEQADAQAPVDRDGQGLAHGALAGVPRPLWLLPEPLALPERDGRPWHHGPLRLRLGPERIEAGWWEAQPVQRDYYVAEDAQAALYWVFRARPDPHAPAAWYLQGRFG